MKTHVINLNYKSLSQFTKDDTLYVSRVINRFRYFFLCKFIRYEKGVVHAQIIDVEHDYLQHYLGTEVRARPGKCYLWGKRGDDNWERAHWFKGDKAE
jgi:hypothetical protein